MARQKTRRPLTDEQRVHRSAAHKAWRAAHPDYHKTRYAAHREERLATMKAWKEEHHEDHLAYMKTWHAAHKEHDAAYAKVYEATHVEQRIAWSRAYMPGDYRANKAAFIARAEQRRALVRQAPIVDLTITQWRMIVAAYKRCCAYCGKSQRRLTKDHVVPLAKGGSHTASNIVPACRQCNARKYTKPPPCPTQIVLPLF